MIHFHPLLVIIASNQRGLKQPMFCQNLPPFRQPYKRLIRAISINFIELKGDSEMSVGRKWIQWIRRHHSTLWGQRRKRGHVYSPIEGKWIEKINVIQQWFIPLYSRAPSLHTWNFKGGTFESFGEQECLAYSRKRKIGTRGNRRKHLSWVSSFHALIYQNCLHSSRQKLQMWLLQIIITSHSSAKADLNGYPFRNLGSQIDWCINKNCDRIQTDCLSQRQIYTTVHNSVNWIRFFCFPNIRKYGQKG